MSLVLLNRTLGMTNVRFKSGMGCSDLVVALIKEDVGGSLHDFELLSVGAL